MMRLPGWMRPLVLATALAVLAVLACGPAAGAPQSGGGEEISEAPTARSQPMFTPTPTLICYTSPSGATGCEAVGPRNLPQHLRRAYSRHMERKAEREEQVARGVPAEVLKSRKVSLRIYADKVEAVAPLVGFLEDRGSLVEYSGTGQSRGYVGAVLVHRVDIDFLGTIAAMDGVGLIEEIKRLRSPFENLRADLTVVMETPQQAEPLLEFLVSIGDSVDSYKGSKGEDGTVVVKIQGLLAGYIEDISALDGMLSMTGGVSEPRSGVPNTTTIRRFRYSPSQRG